MSINLGKIYPGNEKYCTSAACGKYDLCDDDDGDDDGDDDDDDDDGDDDEREC